MSTLITVSTCHHSLLSHPLTPPPPPPSPPPLHTHTQTNRRPGFFCLFVVYHLRCHRPECFQNLSSPPPFLSPLSLPLSGLFVPSRPFLFLPCLLRLNRCDCISFSLSHSSPLASQTRAIIIPATSCHRVRMCQKCR